MPTKSNPGQRRRHIPSVPIEPRIKVFQSASWYDGFTARSADDYCAHILTELGRLRLQVRDIESYDRPPHTRTVLSDLLDWMVSHPGKAYAQLTDWRTLDLAQMRSRLDKNRDAKPRIELSAEITKMNNLSVRWHPGGWQDSVIDWRNGASDHFNLIPRRRWREPPDFLWFTGDEAPYFDTRPSNELMFLRGVGNLRPKPIESFGPYATYNRDVVDSVLICAVRAAYERLIDQLSHSFEVAVLDGFDFVTRDEFEEPDGSSFRVAVHRVVSWQLEDASQLKKRREQERAERQKRDDLAALEGMQSTYGLKPEDLVTKLISAGMRKRTGPPPNAENINRNTAKSLRIAGHKIDAGQVRQLRQLIERYRPELLPEALLPLRPTASHPDDSENVVKFPTGE